MKLRNLESELKAQQNWFEISQGNLKEEIVNLENKLKLAHLEMESKSNQAEYLQNLNNIINVLQQENK